MKNRAFRTSFAVACAAIATLLSTPQANAEITWFLWVLSPRTPNLDVTIVPRSDTLPIWCRVTVRDLDAFGSVRAHAQVLNSNSAVLEKTFGPYPSGHHLQVDGSCRDRSGDVESFSSVETIP